MVKFEYNMLVLNNAFSEEDVDHINAFADYVRKQERERIAKLLEELRDSEYSEVMTHDDLISLIIDK
jgi:hypothetical protein